MQPLSAAEEVDEIVARVFPGEQLGPRQALWVEEIVRSASGNTSDSS